MMKHRLYNLVIGGSILGGLYFSLPLIIYTLVALLLFEGITGILFTRILGKLKISYLDNEIMNFTPKTQRFSFQSERAWSLLVGLIFIISYILFFEILWFIPWFMGFAILGAGVSGVCPMLIAFKFMGFKGSRDRNSR